MKITDEVAYAITDTLEIELVNGDHFVVRKTKQAAEAVIQAYLKSIWKPFDKDDESTWPIYHKGFFVKCEDGDFLESHWRGENLSCEAWQRLEVTHYLDPVDIMVTDVRGEQENG